MTKQKIAKRLFDVDTGTLQFEFSDGFNTTYKLTDLPEAMQSRVALHGLAAKLGDGFSKTTGCDQAREQTADIWANLIAGDWTAGSRGAGTSRLAQAIANVSGQPLADVVKTLSDLNAKTRKIIRNEPAVAREMARLEVEAADALPAATDDLIGSLFGDAPA